MTELIPDSIQILRMRYIRIVTLFRYIVSGHE